MRRRAPGVDIRGRRGERSHDGDARTDGLQHLRQGWVHTGVGNQKGPPINTVRILGTKTLGNVWKRSH